MKSISETQSRSDVQKECPRDRRGENKRTFHNTVIGDKELPREKTEEEIEIHAISSVHQKKKKNKKKSDQKTLHADGTDNSSASVVPQVCVQCSVPVGDVDSSLKEETLCKQCQNGKTDCGSSDSKEPVVEIMSSIEPEVISRER